MDCGDTIHVHGVGGEAQMTPKCFDSIFFGKVVVKNEFSKEISEKKRSSICEKWGILKKIIRFIHTGANASFYISVQSFDHYVMTYEYSHLI